MSAFSYLRGRLGEFLLVLISAWSVASVALNGFFLDSITEQLGYGVRLVMCAGLVLVLTLVLYIAAGAKSRAVGAVLFVVVAAVMVAAALGMSGGDLIYDDAEGNFLYFVIVPIVASLACFALTRTLAGCMVWFVVATFSCSLIQAFYLSEELALSLVSTVSSVALVIYRNFSIGVRGAQLKGKNASRFAFPVSLAPAVLATALAAVAWFAIIAPLSPGVLDVKLITEYRRLPIEEYVGVAQEHPIINYEMTSDQLVDGEYYTTDDLELDANSDTVIDAVSIAERLQALGISGSGSGGSSGGGTQQQFSNDAQDPEYDPVSYTDTVAWILLVILIILLVAALIALFFLVRRRKRLDRLAAYLSEDPTSQIILLYRFIYSRLQRLGFNRPEGMTLREFASTSSHSMDMLTEEIGVSFQALTETYIACDYGDYVPSEDDVVPFATYYLRFWKAARAYLGNVKYFFKSFRL